MRRVDPVNTVATEQKSGRCLARQTGLSLVEVVVVVGITSILAAIAVPTFAAHAAKQRAALASDEFVLGLQTARSEAIKRIRPVVLCPTTDALSSSPLCASVGYEAGWIVYVDDNGNGAMERSEEVLLRTAAAEGDLTISSDTLAERVRFDHNGASVKDSGRPLAGSLTITAGDIVHDVSVVASGRVSAERR